MNAATPGRYAVSIVAVDSCGAMATGERTVIVDRAPQREPPSAKVRVRVIGQGTVYPPPGTYEFASVAPNDGACADFCAGIGADPGGCDCTQNQVEMHAYPARHWIFNRWTGSISSYEARKLFPVKDREELVAEFIPDLGTRDLNLRNDLRRLVSVVDSDSELNSFDIDGGGDWIRGHKVHSITGDGVPDLAQVLMLQRVLQEIHMPSVGTRDFNRERVVRIWNTNCARARQDMPHADDWLKRITAAYMSLDNGGQRGIQSILYNYFDTYVEVENYSHGWDDFAADEDPDNDAIRNDEEWEYAKLVGPQFNEDPIELFGILATNRYASKYQWYLVTLKHMDEAVKSKKGYMFQLAPDWDVDSGLR